MIVLQTLIEWLGVEGAIAGIDGSELTIVEIGELIPNWRPAGHSKLKRRELIRAVVEQKRLDLTKKPEDLMTMDADSLKSYFLSIKASKKEIMDLLESLDIRPGSVARNNLTEFAAREISDIGMYKRVAQGAKTQEQSEPGLRASYVLQKNNGDKFYFTLKANNGEKLLTSENYADRSSALRGIDSVKMNATNDARYERKDARDGKPMFNLNAANGTIIGTSETYSSKSARDDGIQAVKKFASLAFTADQT